MLRKTAGTVVIWQTDLSASHSALPSSAPSLRCAPTRRDLPMVCPVFGLCKSFCFPPDCVNMSTAARQGRRPGPQTRAAIQGRSPRPQSRAAVQGRSPGPQYRAAVQGRNTEPQCRAAVQGRLKNPDSRKSWGHWRTQERKVLRQAHPWMRLLQKKYNFSTTESGRSPKQPDDFITRKNPGLIGA